MYIGIILASIAVPVVIEVWWGSSWAVFAPEIGLGACEDGNADGGQAGWAGIAARMGLMILSVAAAVFAV